MISVKYWTHVSPLSEFLSLTETDVRTILLVKLSKHTNLAKIKKNTCIFLQLFYSQ